MKYILIYGPVIGLSERPVLKHYAYKFHNATKERNKALEGPKSEMEQYFFCDSGGFQIYKIEKDRRKNKATKRWDIIPGVGTKNNSKRLIIDPIDVCRVYGRMRIKYGFTVDVPFCGDATHQEIKDNCHQSFKWAELMFRFRKKYCPKTNLLIPLHYRSKQELYDSFNMMSTLNPEGYAIPVRNTDNYDDFVKLAYSMCYLHYKGVEIFHMLGSSRAEIIILGATAIALNMFDQVSFDSISYNTAIYENPNYLPKYFEPKTLKAIKISGDQRTLILPKKIKDKVLRQEEGTSFDSRKYLILLHNIMATQEYAREMVKCAQSITRLKRYVNSQGHLSEERDRLTVAVDLLSKTVSKGYPFIDSWYDYLWI